MRTIGYDQRRYSSFQFRERFLGIPRIAEGGSFGFIAEKKVCVVECLVESIAEHLGDEGLRTGNGDFRPVLSGNLDGLPNGRLAGCGIGEHISFDEKPLRIFDALFVYMVGRQMAGDGQTSTHGALGIRSDNADACSSRLIHNDGIADIDTQLFEQRIKDSEWLFIEGYVFANPATGQTAIREAIKIARQHGTKIAVTCSEAFIPQVFGDALNQALDHADLLFCNEAEASSLGNARNAEEAFSKLKGRIPS